MSILKPAPSDHPADLAVELVSAREAYESAKNSVLERATLRQRAIEEVQRDLAEEAAALENIVTNAR